MNKENVKNRYTKFSVNIMQRVVHLDLKGAPLKIGYLEQVLLVVKSWGATGVLIEWEDTFPYTAELMEIGSVVNSGGDNMYSMEEVQHIFRFCKENGLQVIQLVQTIGHMEFVLKHPHFKHLRELDLSPAVLCPSKPESQSLVKLMLEQTLDAQPDADYFHIGADEVWHTGQCTDCLKRVEANEHKTASLYLEHIRNIATFLKQKRPNLTILMWDDMLRSISLDTLRSYNLQELVQPMLWDYNIKQYFFIKPSLWCTYQQLFPKVWAASAFKGANGSCKILSPVSRYVSNHEAWIEEIDKYTPSINFSGIILTGWTRYDHFATLCELMPVSLPSLASCLKTLTKRVDTGRDIIVSEDLPSEQWPGQQLAHCIRYFVGLNDDCNAFMYGPLVSNWATPWQLEKKYTNPVKARRIAHKTSELLKDLLQVKNDLTNLLSDVTGKRSTDEWIGTNVMPVVDKMSELLAATEDRRKEDAPVYPNIS